MTVAIIGNLSLDRVAGGAPRAGGPVLYAARAAARLHGDVRLAARCAGSDTDVALTPLEEAGLPLVWQPGRITAAFAFHYEGERRVMSVEAVGDPWTPADVTGWAATTLAEAEWVHVGALLRSDFGVETLRAVAAEGRRLLVDAQGLVRRAEVGPLRRDGDVGADILRTVQVLKLSEAEAQLLAGGVGVAALRSLGVPEVVLTLGSAGSLVVTHDQAEPVTAKCIKVSDPTGAGDTYSLGYIAARDGGAEPVEAARRASELVATVLAERA